MAIDVTGERYGRLVALERTPPKRPKETLWLWRCDCGVEKEISLRNVRQGETRSCGCLHRERQREAPMTHGHTGSRTLRSYEMAKQRCFSPTNNRFEMYGGRGITMCERWRNDFAAFLADMGERPEGTTLERQDNDGNYEPGNCRWATPAEQSHNRRTTLVVDEQGRSLKTFAREEGLSYSVLRHHYRGLGKTFAEAVEATRNPGPLARRSKHQPMPG